jgi:hypothetical protein
MENNKDNILGCYVSISLGDFNDSDQEKEKMKKDGEVFREYIFGINGINNKIKELKNHTYGNDFKLILFQFYVNPIQYEIMHIKEVESYRKKEKSVGLSIIINHQTFFSKSEEQRIKFIQSIMLDRLEQINAKKNKYDLNIDKLKQDLEDVLALKTET